MDFRQTSQPANNRSSAPEATTTSASHSAKEVHIIKSDGISKWLKVFNVVVLIGAALIMALLALAVARSAGGGNNEFKYVDQTRYQAVFLQNGQVYFGNIKSLNANYIRLSNVYYLTQSATPATSGSTSSSSAYNLVQLGKCQIHYPDNQMVINHDQVTFWENLQAKGQVVSSINQLKKQFPNGQNCSQVSSQTQASDTSGTQGDNSATNSTK